MILSFKKQFLDKILSGSKIHTIRADPHGRWKAGNKIHHAHGVRTAKYDCFLENDCMSVQVIRIRHLFPMVNTGNKIEFAVRVYVDSTLLKSEIIKELARNDGFDSVEDFFRWFNSDFYGKIIHWTDFRY